MVPVTRLIDIAAVMVLIAFFLPGPIGQLEGHYFPVVTDVSITAEPASETSTEVHGRMRIVRRACEFRGIEWRLIGPDRTALADVKFIEGTKARPGGWNDFGPWHISMPTERLLARSAAVVTHQCPMRPWLTTSTFYP